MNKITAIVLILSFMLYALPGFAETKYNFCAKKKTAKAQTAKPQTADKNTEPIESEDEYQSSGQGIEALSEAEWDGLPEEPR